mmetsp:Transcript_32409/g.64163  ORF Transcript_32409/g.64163 Transcript_32409/m.64163 type:complete len:240 (+) Transcript_32409:122-841(+)
MQKGTSATSRRLALCFLVGILLAMASRATALAANATSNKLYPGTAVARMEAIRKRARSLSKADLSGDWDSTTRPKLLWAAGLKDLRTAAPGAGYTGHSFNDWNHVDATAMLASVQAETNANGAVPGISRSNNLHSGIIIASDPELGEGGTWSTCQLGCNRDPPMDVAHVQFQSRIAFKLVWCPPTFTEFVLVDDDGALLNRGKPTGALPSKAERSRNFQAVQGSKYAAAAAMQQQSEDL